MILRRKDTKHRIVLMKILDFVLLSFSLLFVVSINLSAQDHHDWSYNLPIYEVNVRQYTSTGTFAEFSTHLNRLKELGAGILWFMPIHPIGVQNRIGSLGSYYSVKDYYGINSEFGTLEDFKTLVDSIDADGFRCDAVSFMPLDFWATAITELKNDRSEIFMLAEDNGAQYNTAGFDMTYAWGLLGFGNGILPNIVAGTNNANVLNTYATQENISYPAPFYKMYFTSNHDENSWYETVYELFGNAAEAFAVLTSTFRSMPLIYNGQEAGLNHRLKFFDKDQIIWQNHPFAEMYRKLFQLKKNNKALWNGAAGEQLQRVTTTNNPAIFAFVRSKENCKVFAIFNLTNQ